MQATDKIIAALRAAPEGRAWVRGLRDRMMRYGVPVVVDAGTRQRRTLTIRHAATEAEGPAGALVAELYVEGAGARVIATENGPVREQPSSAGHGRMKIRAVRLDDETWAACKAEGDASVVVRNALAEYFERRGNNDNRRSR